VKLSDVPHLRETDVSESKTPDPKPEHKVAEHKAAPVLGRAGESSDPAVHSALADLETYERVGDKDGAKKAVARLHELGVDV
jgi:hypothetical protein